VKFLTVSSFIEEGYNNWDFRLVLRRDFRVD